MDYSNINYTPEKNDSPSPHTGWANPFLDIAYIRKWYDNFEDWQSKLPKTDYSLSKSSLWYTHEWVPGVPVMPNLSRPPLRQNYKQRFTPYQSAGSRFITTPDDYLLVGNGSVSLEQDYYHEVWYRRIITTIRTVLVTITTTIINSTVGDVVSEAHNGHSRQNGVRTLDFSDNEEFTDTMTLETLYEEAWYTRIFKTVFGRVMSTFGSVSYAVASAFYSLYQNVVNVEAYCLRGLHDMLGLRHAQRRFWALLLLLIVPYLILFGMFVVNSYSFPSVETVAHLSDPYSWMSLDLAPINV